MVANINQRGMPDYTGASGQTGSGYPLALDAANQVFANIARNFAPHASESGSPSAPNMTVTLDAGRIWNPVTRAYVAIGSQTTGTITAPAANPRRDIVYVDRLTGAVSVQTGSEAASPADPTIPVGKTPVARINLTVGMTVIDDMDIDDLRTLAMFGVPFGHGDELSRIYPGSASPDEYVRGTLDEIPIWQKVAGLWRSVQPRHLLDGLERLDTGSPSLSLDDDNDLVPVWRRSRRELMMIAAGAIGGGGSFVIQQFAASGTYTPTTGMKYCLAFVTGAGGGGGGATASNIGGGGGGGAAPTAVAALSASQIGSSQTVTIGAGGTAGTSGGANGGTGGNTSLGTLVTSNGAAGGTTATTASGTLGGLGGATTGGTPGGVTLTGGDGHSSGWGDGSVHDGHGGNGGASFWGGGGRGWRGGEDTAGSATGSTGRAPGSGGGGGNRSSNGGEGAPGYVFIIEFI